MKMMDIVDAADRAAQQVWRVASGPGAFSWRDCVGRPRASVAAQWCVANPEKTAAELYRFLMAVASERDGASWQDIPPALRCSIEVYRATFLILYREASAEAPKQQVTA